MHVGGMASPLASWSGGRCFHQSALAHSLSKFWICYPFMHLWILHVLGKFLYILPIHAITDFVHSKIVLGRG